MSLRSPLSQRKDSGYRWSSKARQITSSLVFSWMMADTCVPWEHCDAILSLLRDPRFNSRDVSFKDCGDMYCQVGEYRERAWSLVEGQRGRGTTTMPQVVLDGIFNVLRVELETHRRQLGRDSEIVKVLLKNMALVHPSWHGSAKRLLNYSVQFDTFSLRNIDKRQAPFIGRWTQVLDVTHLFQPEDASVILSKELSKIRHLCLRTDSIRFLCLNLAIGDSGRGEVFPEVFLEALYKAFSAFAYIEEITVQAFYIPSKLIRLISEAHRETLRFMCFDISEWEEGFYEKANILDIYPLLASFPNLQSVRISTTDWKQRLPSITRVSWLRNPSEHNSFFLSEICIRCIPFPPGTYVRDRNIGADVHVQEMLQSSRLIDFVVFRDHDLLYEPTNNPGEEKYLADAIIPLLGWCNLAREIVLRNVPWFYTKSFFNQLREGGVVPKSVRELLIVSPPPLPSADPYIEEMLQICAFPWYDAIVAKAVEAGIAPGLQVLNVLLVEFRAFSQVRHRPAKETISICAYHYADAALGRLGASKDLEGPELYGHLLPLCKQKCAERGITFKVDVDC